MSFHQLYSAIFLLLDVDECSRETARCNHGCNNTVGSYDCYCYSGYRLLADRVTCHDIDECNENSSKCGQLCNNTLGSYNCDCQNGYRLDSDGFNCSDINECTESTSCGNHQKCINTHGSYQCMCLAGYQPDYNTMNDLGTYRHCKDIDECSGEHGCSQECINLPGTYRCSCINGYILHADKRRCLDINECLMDNGDCAHICKNSDGSYYCDCYSGYELLDNKHNCTDVLECQEGLHNCSQNCDELEGGFSCSCNAGYTLAIDYVTCEDDDECQMGLAKCEQNCRNTNGSYECNCYDGFQLNPDNMTCTDVDECQENNGGCGQICNNTVGSHSCSCKEGYQLELDGANCTGKYCPLLTKPKNGDYSCSGLQITGTTCRFWCNFGYKRVGPKRLKCMTTSMWSGNISSCEILQCDPLENPENGSVILPCGTKVNTNCSILCSPGFYTTSVAPFQRCEPTEYNNATQWSKPPNCTERQPCFPNPCKHNGVCVITEEISYICNCDSTGYTGEDCNVLIIDAPDFSAIAVDSPTEFSVSAQPDRSFILEMMPDSRKHVEVIPPTVMFSSSVTNWNVSITAKKSGMYKLEYRISDDTLNYYPIPPATILVSDDRLNQSNYFNKHKVKSGLLQQGCCQTSEEDIKTLLKCPQTDNKLV
ncbi:multiple epidermal growth factor-like domains protein 6 [Dysidea avara]|uniref:multiple epidermal growth factor-like domains protein 6 n=1 Tax=Dysidea avara TaxID=196820 RepID=UPI00333159AF